MSKSIRSFFKSAPIVNSSSSTKDINKDIENTVNTVDSVNIVHNVNYINCVNSVDNGTQVDTSGKPSIVSGKTLFKPPENFSFPKTRIGQRERHCQYNWFKNYQWLHYDVQKDSVICFYCMVHENKLNAEHNKALAYISTGFKSWKKAPKCFKEHEESKCHKAALTYQVVVPQCGDAEMLNNDKMVKQRYNERQYLKVLMECLQFLGRQGIGFRGNEDGNDNLTQLMLLRGKDNNDIVDRITSHVSGKKRYTHHDYQDELLNLMANQVLRKKLCAIKESPFFSIMCDEYTDISNKEQLSFCIRWIDSSLNAREDFLSYYEIPNISSNTIVAVIKDALIRFNLSLSNLRGQTYDGASNMLGCKSGIAKQIKDHQPKALETHCHGHSLSLSVKDMTKQCRLLNDIVGVVGEITILVKYSPKRENLLGKIQENLQFDEEKDDEIEVTSLSKLCVTRWTVRATTYKKVLSNYDPLLNLWDVCLQDKLDKEIRSRIIGCESQMKTFEFFYGLHLSHKIYSLTDNLSKTLQKESMSALEGQRIANLTIKTFQDMRTKEAADLFYKYVVGNASSHKSIAQPMLPRKRKRPNYQSLVNFFQVDGYENNGEEHYSRSPEEFYSVIYFEALDLITTSIKSRFDQPSFKAFLKLESFLLESLSVNNVNPELVNFIEEMYGDDLSVASLQVETSFLRTIIGQEKVVCFDDIYKKIKKLSNAEKSLISNVILCKLLLVNAATSCTPERSISSARRVKTWLWSTMTSKRFNNLAILNIHKELTATIDLASVGNDFVSLHEQRYRDLGKFIDSDFL